MALGFCPHKLSSFDLIDVLKAAEGDRAGVVKRVKEALALRDAAKSTRGVKPKAVEVSVPVLVTPCSLDDDEWEMSEFEENELVARMEMMP